MYCILSILNATFNNQDVKCSNADELSRLESYYFQLSHLNAKQNDCTSCHYVNVLLIPSIPKIRKELTIFFLNLQNKMKLHTKSTNYRCQSEVHNCQVLILKIS